MAALTDLSIGLANETTFGTYVAPTRFYEFTDEDFSFEPIRVQGEGLRVGGILPRSGRRVTTRKQAAGSFTVPCISKGMGLLWQSIFGTSASTLVSGSTYQQNHTLIAGPVNVSRTIQKGLVRADGTVDPYSFLGCTVDEWEFVLEDELATLRTTWDARDMTTAQSYATPSYVTTPNLFHFGHAAITVGGSVTAPTTTTLASGGTAVTNVRSFKVGGNRKINKERFNFGNSGLKKQQLVGGGEITGEIVVEYDVATYRDAFIADTALPIVLTLTSEEALSTGFAQLQIVLSETKFDGAIPVANNGELITVAHPFTVLDNLTAAQPIYVCQRTADTAL
jgi:hypothetical protein